MLKHVCNRGLTDADIVAILGKIQVAESDLDLAGAFVETAYTLEHIERTIEEEKRLGIRKGPCAFLDDQNSDVMTDQVGKEKAQMVRSEKLSIVVR